MGAEKIKKSIHDLVDQIEDEQLAQRMLISLNNICESIGHVSTQKMDSETYDLGILHG